MPPMTDAQLKAFLHSDVICRLGCLDEDGYPYVVPCWFQYAEGGFYIIPRARSAWATYLQADGRVSLCLDRENGDRALVKGRAICVEEPNVGGKWVAIGQEMAKRYRGDAGIDYLNKTLDEPRWLFFVEPERTITWTGAGGWAEKYKHTQWS